jgi:hypothetical protein
MVADADELGAAQFGELTRKKMTVSVGFAALFLINALLVTRPSSRLSGQVPFPSPDTR